MAALVLFFLIQMKSGLWVILIKHVLKISRYVGGQLRQLNSRYQVQLNVGKDVLKKVEGNLEQHQQFLNNYEKAQQWMEKLVHIPILTNVPEIIYY